MRNARSGVRTPACLPAPVIQGADFYPVAATPPLEETNLSTLPAEQERQGVVVPTAGLRPAGGRGAAVCAASRVLI